MGRPTWVEIDLDAIAHNLQQFRGILTASVAIIGCIKANAYGHGLLPVARLLAAKGVDILAVGNVNEGVRLRRSGIATPIKVFGNTLPDTARLFAEYDLMPTFFTPQDADGYMKVLGPKVPLRVWIKVETGLSRLGILPQDVIHVVQKVLDKTRYQIIGLYTHLGNRAGTQDKSHAESQWASFKELLDKLESMEIHIPHLQAANGAATVCLPHTWLNTVSIGHGLYGILQVEDAKYQLNFRRAFRALRSRLISVASFGKGSDIGGTVVPRRSLIAVAPIGCGDGFSCRNEGADVLVRGVRARQIGKISLEHIRIDVTDVPKASVGDEVTMLGRQGEDEITLEEASQRLKVPMTEIWTAVHPSSVSYLYLREGELTEVIDIATL
jgi:alanine racemase